MSKLYKSILIICLFITNVLMAQTPTYMFDEKSGQEIMLGKCEESFLKKGVFGEYYSLEYPNYIPNPEVINQIKSLLKTNKTQYEVVVVLGTWCGDSKDQVPRFIKIMDSINNQNLTIQTYICVDRTKSAPSLKMEDYKIEKIPTFIFYKNNIEIGRIVETPLKSLESDLLEILNK